MEETRELIKQQDMDFSESLRIDRAKVSRNEHGDENVGSLEFISS